MGLVQRSPTAILQIDLCAAVGMVAFRLRVTAPAGVNQQSIGGEDLRLQGNGIVGGNRPRSTLTFERKTQLANRVNRHRLVADDQVFSPLLLVAGI